MHSSYSAPWQSVRTRIGILLKRSPLQFAPVRTVRSSADACIHSSRFTHKPHGSNAGLRLAKPLPRTVGFYAWPYGDASYTSNLRRSFHTIVR